MSVFDSDWLIPHRADDGLEVRWISAIGRFMSHEKSNWYSDTHPHSTRGSVVTALSSVATPASAQWGQTNTYTHIGTLTLTYISAQMHTA